MKYLVVVISILFFQVSVFGQSYKTFKNLDEMKSESKKIVDHFANEKGVEAFARLKDVWVLPLNELESLESQTIKQLNLLEGRFGEIVGSKLVNEELLENVLYRLTYVLKFEKHGLRFIFTYYNGKEDKWVLNGFKWDDSLSKLLEK